MKKRRLRCPPERLSGALTASLTTWKDEGRLFDVSALNGTEKGVCFFIGAQTSIAA
jgi:hypothetical protein